LANPSSLAWTSSNPRSSRRFPANDNMISPAEDTATAGSSMAIHDAAAHAVVLAQQLAITIAEIRTQYPKNSLGGLVDRVDQLAVFAQGHADALTHAADAAMRGRPELAGLAEGTAIDPPASVLMMFERAELIQPELTVPEAAQLAQQGKLVILRDRRVQDRHLVAHGAAVFSAGEDWTAVRLWWPRVFSSAMAVALMSTEQDGVWIETSMGEEDLPG
jgi:hypothetical protein